MCQCFPAQVTPENMVNIFVGKVSKWGFVADIAIEWRRSEMPDLIAEK